MEEANIDAIKKLAIQIKNKIETSTHEEHVNLLNELYDKWIVPPDENYTFSDYIDKAIKNLGITKKNLQLGTFEKAKNTAIFQITYLRENIEKNENISVVQKEIYEEKFTKLFRSIIDADNAIGFSLFLMSSMTMEGIGSEKKSKYQLFRYSEIDYSKLTPYQTLLLYLSDQLQKRQYRRYVVNDKGLCYEKIYNEKGYYTHAWKKAMSIKEFIQKETDKNYNFERWLDLTQSKDNLEACVKYFTHCCGPEFEDIEKQRNVYSFNNGVYITKNWCEEENEWKDLWIPFEGPGSIKIGETIISCKLFNMDFVKCEYDDWFEIIKTHCPNFMSVMKGQDWTEEQQRWMCILIGRMMYKIGELDNWQVLPYLLGMAGTGKSTILENVVKILYDSEDVGTLSNNIEKKFGTASLSKKKIFIGPEIKSNLQLEQAEFQSMISGETMTMAEKGLAPLTVKFETPGMCAGNELPNFTDNAGSMTRRFVVFYFGNKIKKGDTRLGKKIQTEISYIIQACNRGYLKKIKESGKTGIWELLPKIFIDSQEKMAENTNSLTHFLKSPLVTFGKNGRDENGVLLYCREKVFVSKFNDHCRDCHFASTKWTSQFYAGPFADFDLKFDKNTRRRYPNKEGCKSYNGSFIMGVDIVDLENNASDETDDDNSSKGTKSETKLSKSNFMFKEEPENF